jgi:hypothetical protein
MLRRGLRLPPSGPTPEAEAAPGAHPEFGDRLREVSPTWSWDPPQLQFIRRQLQRITDGELKKLILVCPI